MRRNQNLEQKMEDNVSGLRMGKDAQKKLRDISFASLIGAWQQKLIAVVNEKKIL